MHDGRGRGVNGVWRRLAIVFYCDRMELPDNVTIPSAIKSAYCNRRVTGIVIRIKCVFFK